MAEVYTVLINNETPTEITGGRVGWFRIESGSSAAALGASDLSISSPHSPPAAHYDGVIANGFAFSGAPFYVTSPDEIYAINSGSGDREYEELPLKIFHNR